MTSQNAFSPRSLSCLFWKWVCCSFSSWSCPLHCNSSSSHTCAKTSLPLERVWKAQSSSLARCSSSSASCWLFKLKYTLKALLVWVTCHSPAQKYKVDTKATSVARMEQLTASLFAKDCLLTLVKSRLALGSPGCRLFVTMPKMAQYTEKWLLTAP